jgi:hypothetical protein
MVFVGPQHKEVTLTTDVPQTATPAASVTSIAPDKRQHERSDTKLKRGVSGKSFR